MSDAALTIALTGNPHEIVAVNFVAREVIMGDGDILLITAWIDHWGDECDRDHAERFLAGRGDKWLIGEIGDYAPATIH